MCSIQSTISSYSRARRFGVYLWRIPMHIHNIRKLSAKRRRQEYQDGGKL
jgi:hypothetical protein